MGLASWLGFGKEVAEPIRAVGDLYTTDKARIEAETKYEEIIQKPVLAQLANNGIMAAAQNIFEAGWQPLLGWTAGFLVLIYYAPQILIITYVWGRHCIDSGLVAPFPMKADDILNLVYLLFGFGGYSLAKKAITKGT
jgi:hypothetical protein